MSNLNLNIFNTESSDSDISSLSGLGQSEVERMASLEQEATLDSIPEERRGASPQSEASTVGRIPDEDWSKMTKNQKRSHLRRRAGRKGETEAKASGSAKRPREAAGFTPSPNKEERKKPKTEGLQYSQVVSYLKVAITCQEHPHEELPEEAANRLAAKLVDLMRENDPEEGKLTYCGFTFRTGALVINCADKKSKDWMDNTISKLKTWEGLRLKTCDPKELEGFVRIATFLPKPVNEIDLALVNLRIQNGINTTQWRILPGGVKKEPKGLYFVASIPESHYKILEAKNFKLSHGLHVVEVKRLKEKAAKKEKGAERMEVQEAQKEGEKKRAEGKEAVVIPGGEAVSEPVAASGTGPDQPGKDLPASTETMQQMPAVRAEPEAAGGRQDALPGISKEGKVAGKNRRDRGKTSDSPPPS